MSPGVDGKKYVSCLGASDLVMIATIVTGDSSPSDTEGELLKHVAKARAKCWSIVDAAMDIGQDKLRDRHVESFSASMGNTIVHLDGERGDSKHLQSCGDDKLSSQFECVRSSKRKSSSGVAQLTTKGVWFGRYLLLSSASNAVANLQGIWADGPDSAWSGDYHLNINLQMVYWAAHPMGLGHVVLPPLIKWIVDMAKSGENTARSMYGCPGWVAHGFTDNWLDVGVRGGLEWALCVTCGAWVALHLWDHISFDFDISFVHNIILPVYRSLAQFFLSYMFKDSEGLYHTGPTTSPEVQWKNILPFVCC